MGEIGKKGSNPIYARRTAPMKSVVALYFLLALASGLPNRAFPAGAADREPAADTAGAMGFSEAARRLILDSPYLRNSAIEIDLRRMDERDSRYGVLPSVSFRTRYFVDPPDDLQGKEPYAIDFVIDAYNPIERFYTIEVRKIITAMAVLRHLQAISESLERLGTAYLELDGLDELAQFNRQWIALAEQYAAYQRTRLDAGSATPLERSAADLEVAIGQAEQEKIAAARKSILHGLRGLLGLPEDQALAVACGDLSRELYGEVDLAAVSFSAVKENALDMQIHNLKLALQKRHITLARTRYLPNLLLGLQTTDPLGSRTDNGLFFSIGFELPLWDGLKRFNDIERQQVVLRQYQAEEEVKSIDLTNKWENARNRLAETATQLRLAHVQRDLSGLREMQVETGYQAGRDSFANLLAERRRVLEMRKNLATRSLEHRKTLLTLHKLSGDLLRRFVNPGAWQEPLE